MEKILPPLTEHEKELIVKLMNYKLSKYAAYYKASEIGIELNHDDASDKLFYGVLTHVLGFDDSETFYDSAREISEGDWNIDEYFDYVNRARSGEQDSTAVVFKLAD